jgi:acetoin utilization protein AcuB
MSKLKVRDVMTKKFFRVMANDTFENAKRLAIINRVKFLIVMQNDKVVGIITEDDLLKDASPKEKVAKIMSSNIPKLLESGTINEAAKIILDNKLSCIPVFNELDDIVGVVSETDLVKDAIALAT